MLLKPIFGRLMEEDFNLLWYAYNYFIAHCSLGNLLI